MSLVSHSCISLEQDKISPATPWGKELIRVSSCRHRQDLMGRGDKHSSTSYFAQISGLPDNSCCHCTRVSARWTCTPCDLRERCLRESRRVLISWMGIARALWPPKSTVIPKMFPSTSTSFSLLPVKFKLVSPTDTSGEVVLLTRSETELHSMGI